MANKSVKKRKKTRAVVLFALLCVCLVATVIVSQENKLRAIAQEQLELQEVINGQEDEKARLEYMIEYAQNEAYLIQYAREKLGYVEEDEIKFNIED